MCVCYDDLPAQAEVRQAATEGDIAALKRLLEEGVSVKEMWCDEARLLQFGSIRKRPGALFEGCHVLRCRKAPPPSTSSHIRGTSIVLSSSLPRRVLLSRTRCVRFVLLSGRLKLASCHDANICASVFLQAGDTPFCRAAAGCELAAVKFLMSVLTHNGRRGQRLCVRDRHSAIRPFTFAPALLAQGLSCHSDRALHTAAPVAFQRPPLTISQRCSCSHEAAMSAPFAPCSGRWKRTAASFATRDLKRSFGSSWVGSTSFSPSCQSGRAAVDAFAPSSDFCERQNGRKLGAHISRCLESSRAALAPSSLQEADIGDSGPLLHETVLLGGLADYMHEPEDYEDGDGDEIAQQCVRRLVRAVLARKATGINNLNEARTNRHQYSFDLRAPVVLFRRRPGARLGHVLSVSADSGRAHGPPPLPPLRPGEVFTRLAAQQNGQAVS